jgi:catechol-2,3-dioxygenase
MQQLPVLTLSHFEIRTSRIAEMEQFYTQALGFAVTDRSESGGMVFLSRNPVEHHQLVLAAADGGDGKRLDHIAFRAGSLGEIRACARLVGAMPEAGLQPVSHGNSWSLYFRDPDGNRLEVFTDTPWHVRQPVRFAMDYSLPEEEIVRLTLEHIRTMPDFREVSDWRKDHAENLTV